MRKFIFLTVLSFMLITISADAQRRQPSEVSRKTTFTPKTGDSVIDRHLQEINNYGLADFNSFKRDLSSKFGISRRDVNRIYPKDKIEPGDIFIEPGHLISKPGEDLGSLLTSPGDAFYAYTLSEVSGRPVSSIIDLFSRKQNWEEVTKELGIKSGSNEFNKLRSIALSGLGKAGIQKK